MLQTQVCGQQSVSHPATSLPGPTQPDNLHCKHLHGCCAAKALWRLDVQRKLCKPAPHLVQRPHAKTVETLGLQRRRLPPPAPAASWQHLRGADGAATGWGQGSMPSLLRPAVTLRAAGKVRRAGKAGREQRRRVGAVARVGVGVRGCGAHWRARRPWRGGRPSVQRLERCAVVKARQVLPACMQCWHSEAHTYNDLVFLQYAQTYCIM